MTRRAFVVLAVLAGCGEGGGGGRVRGLPASPSVARRREAAVRGLTARAMDAKAPLTARLTAIRGLRLEAAGDTRSTLAALARDPDERVAKAARRADWNAGRPRGRAATTGTKLETFATRIPSSA